MDPQTPRAYELTYCSSHNAICARGPIETLTALLSLDGAQRSGDLLDPNSFVFFPVSKTSIMAAEAVAVPSAVTDDYRHIRILRMRAPLDQQALTDQLLQYGTPYAPNPILSHQLDFLSHLGRRHARSAFNASEQGTGKTRTGWLALQIWESKRAVIVCPKSLCREWKREHGETWENGQPIDCVVLDEGSSRQRSEEIIRAKDYPHPTALVLNYEVLDTLLSILGHFEPDAVIFDESWRIKTPSAKVTKAAIRLSDQCDHVLLLTGTPIGNDIGDLWSQLRCCGRDLMPENYWQFLQRYAILRPMQLGPRTVHKPVGVSDPAGLMKRLEPVWYRATKAACLDLPPKQMRRVVLPMSAEQRTLYRAVANDGEIALGHDLSLAQAVTVDLRLHEICGGFTPRYNTDTGKMDMLQTISCPKNAWLKDWVHDHLEGNPSARCIIWGAYTHELVRITETVNKILGPGKAVMAWGGTDNDELEEWKQSFQSRAAEGVQVIVAQLKKMAFGHNLQACDYNIYFSNSWSYVVRSQSEDRSHRKGRAEGVEYIDLMVDNSIDLDIMAALDTKQDFAGRMAPATVTRETNRDSRSTNPFVAGDACARTVGL